MQLCRKMRDTEIAIFLDGNITKDIELFKSLGLIKIIDNYSNGIYEKDLFVKVGEYKAKDVYIDKELQEKLEIKDFGYAGGCYKWQNVQLFNWIKLKIFKFVNRELRHLPAWHCFILSNANYMCG